MHVDVSRERLGGGGHCPRMCSRTLPVPRSVALYLQVVIYQGHKSEFLFLHMGLWDSSGVCVCACTSLQRQFFATLRHRHHCWDANRSFFF